METVEKGMKIKVDHHQLGESEDQARKLTTYPNSHYNNSSRDTADLNRLALKFVNSDFDVEIYNCLCQAGEDLSYADMYGSSDKFEDGFVNSKTKYPYNISDRVLYTKHEFDAIIHPECDKVRVLKEVGDVLDEKKGGCLETITFASY